MAAHNNYQVKQFKYYGAGNLDKNQPENDLIWCYGVDPQEETQQKHLLSDVEGVVVKLGIQTLPGTIFFLNDDPLSSGIIIDHTGIYELDLTDTTLRIGTLYFDSASLNRISQVKNASLIVDILYEKTTVQEGE